MQVFLQMKIYMRPYIPTLSPWLHLTYCIFVFRIEAGRIMILWWKTLMQLSPDGHRSSIIANQPHRPYPVTLALAPISYLIGSTSRKRIFIFRTRSSEHHEGSHAWLRWNKLTATAPAYHIYDWYDTTRWRAAPAKWATTHSQKLNHSRYSTTSADLLR